MVSNGTIEVFIPTARRRLSELTLAARPASLDGKVLGLLNNTKPNAALLIESVAALIGKQYHLAGLVSFTKGDPHGAAGPMSDEIRSALTGQCDVVLNAIGD